MGFLDWMIGIGFVGLLSRASKKASTSRDTDEYNYVENGKSLASIIADYKAKKRREKEELEKKAVLEEYERKKKEKQEKEERRMNSYCGFTDGISQEEFEAIALSSKKRIKRLTDISVEGPIVYGTVQSHSGISEWCFKVDFNDFGHLTGNYWLSTDNDDSDIPYRVAESIQDAIINHETDNSEKKPIKAWENGPYTFQTSIPCSFEDGISKYDFQQIVKKSVKKCYRIEELKVFDAKVYGLIRSQTGKTTWRFIIDFNDNGHLTGKFRCFTNNEDSQISFLIGEAIKEAIQQRLNSLEVR